MKEIFHEMQLSYSHLQSSMIIVIQLEEFQKRKIKKKAIIELTVMSVYVWTDTSLSERIKYFIYKTSPYIVPKCVI